MKQKFYLLLALLCLLFSLTACQRDGEPAPAPADPAPEITEPDTSPDPEPEPEPAQPLSQREKDWLEDIEALREGYKSMHKDPFYFCSEEDFDFRLDQLAARVGKLSDNDITFEIIAAIAAMGDLHTMVNLPRPLYDRCFPAGAIYWDDKLYLSGYMEGYEQLAPYLLHEIVGVNGIDIAYLNQKAESISSPYNPSFAREFFSNYFIPAFYDWAGCDYKEGYTFQILNDNQEVVSVEIPVITREERFSAGLQRWETWDADFYVTREEGTEYFQGENGGYVSILPMSGLISKSSIGIMARKAGKLLAEHPDCGKLVIDLRRCPGGNANVLTALQEELPALRQAEQIYVLTDGTTASAAIAVCTFFKNELDAILVGEPTGQFPSFFALGSSVEKPLELPHSQISVNISKIWADAKIYRDPDFEQGFNWVDPAWSDWEPLVEEYYDEDGKLYEWEYTVLPDVYVHQDIEDIRQGKDSVIEWVLAQ